MLVVDDHSLVREGTRTILERDPRIEVVGEAPDGETAVAMADTLAPDVVLIDIGLSGMTGLEATRRIRQDHPVIKVLALTIHDDAEYVLGMLDAGASGYLLKDVRDHELTEAVHNVGGGGAVLDPAVTASVLGRVRAQASGGPPPDVLTIRESAVLQLVADGMENREIAEWFGVSHRTVETHMTNVFAKLGVRSRTSAVMAALRLGLVAANGS